MRHTFATWALDAGIDIYDLARRTPLQALMGRACKSSAAPTATSPRARPSGPETGSTRRPSISSTEAADKAER
jgi:hypothetical protein